MKLSSRSRRLSPSGTAFAGFRFPAEVRRMVCGLQRDHGGGALVSAVRAFRRCCIVPTLGMLKLGEAVFQIANASSVNAAATWSGRDVSVAIS